MEGGGKIWIGGTRGNKAVVVSSAVRSWKKPHMRYLYGVMMRNGWSIERQG